jgi:hypothetical protein
MANHYHVFYHPSRALRASDALPYYYGPGLPLTFAQENAVEMANDAQLTRIAGGVWSDAPTADAFNADPGEYSQIQIDPCDNEIDHALPWNAYRDANNQFHRAPNGQPCTAAMKAAVY